MTSPLISNGASRCSNPKSFNIEKGPERQMDISWYPTAKQPWSKSDPGAKRVKSFAGWDVMSGSEHEGGPLKVQLYKRKKMMKTSPVDQPPSVTHFASKNMEWFWFYSLNNLITPKTFIPRMIPHWPENFHFRLMSLGSHTSRFCRFQATWTPHGIDMRLGMFFFVQWLGMFSSPSEVLKNNFFSELCLGVFHRFERSWKCAWACGESVVDILLSRFTISYQVTNYGTYPTLGVSRCSWPKWQEQKPTKPTTEMFKRNNKIRLKNTSTKTHPWPISSHFAFHQASESPERTPGRSPEGHVTQLLQEVAGLFRVLFVYGLLGWLVVLFVWFVLLFFVCLFDWIDCCFFLQEVQRGLAFCLQCGSAGCGWFVLQPVVLLVGCGWFWWRLVGLAWFGKRWLVCGCWCLVVGWLWLVGLVVGFGRKDEGDGFWLVWLFLVGLGRKDGLNFGWLGLLFRLWLWSQNQDNAELFGGCLGIKPSNKQSILGALEDFCRDSNSCMECTRHQTHLYSRRF